MKTLLKIDEIFKKQGLKPLVPDGGMVLWTTTAIIYKQLSFKHSLSTACVLSHFITKTVL